jgi:hypothetical protein
VELLSNEILAPLQAGETNETRSRVCMTSLPTGSEPFFWFGYRLS